MRLTGKIAFITGGTSGIGLATALLFIAEGAKVGVIGRSRQGLEHAAPYSATAASLAKRMSQISLRLNAPYWRQ